MITVLRAHGLRVVIFVDDHEPAHVHVFGDGHAKINLVSDEGSPGLVWAQDMTKGEVRRAFKVIVENQAALLKRWNEIHG